MKNIPRFFKFEECMSLNSKCLILNILNSEEFRCLKIFEFIVKFLIPKLNIFLDLKVLIF